MVVVYVTKVTKKGQTTIPLVLRQQAGIKEEDEVVWFREGKKLVVEPRKKVRNPVEALSRFNLKTKKSAVELGQEAEDEFW